MKVAILFSGGKDSVYAAYLARQRGNELACAIVIKSENQNSYMFHTPSIEKAEKQVEVMGVPILVHGTKGNKEEELKDLSDAVKIAKEKYGVEGIVTGAIESVYQASRIQRICNELDLECFNPLWQKNQIELLENLIETGFEVIVVGVFAFPFDESWLGRKIDEKFILEIKLLQEKYKINPAGEGGEFESFVLDCPLFNKGLEVKSFEDVGEGNSWRREVELK